MTQHSPGDAYREVPYLSDPFPETHPDRLGVIGAMFGLNTVPIERSRVLEIGCSAGNNLIPHAALHPQATFIGIDQVESQLLSGRELIRTLGLSNVELLAADICKVDPGTLGRFDYVIAHGFLSWVAPPVQRALFALLPQLMAPQAVAYVSFNALPGWYGRLSVRQMLHQHLRKVNRPEQRVAQARDFLGVLRASLAVRADLTAQGLAEQVGQMLELPDWYLFHDLLEEENHPLLLSDVVDLAVEHGLQYLGDSVLSKMVPFDLPLDVQRYARVHGKDSASIEQYLDFFRGEYFRRSLFCLGDATLSRERWYERMPQFALRGRPVAVEEPEEESTEDQTAEDRVAESVLSIVHREYPRAVPLIELAALVRQVVAEPDVSDESVVRVLVEVAFRGVMHGTFSPHRWIPPVTSTLSAAPAVTPLARLQAQETNQVTSLFHVPVLLDEVLRNIVVRLDGTVSREELCAELGIEPEALERALELLLGEALLVAEEPSPA